MKSGRAYFQHFNAARLFAEATARAGYELDASPVRRCNVFKGWKISWYRK